MARHSETKLDAVGWISDDSKSKDHCCLSSLNHRRVTALIALKFTHPIRGSLTTFLLDRTSHVWAIPLQSYILNHYSFFQSWSEFFQSSATYEISKKNEFLILKKKKQFLIKPRSENLGGSKIQRAVQIEWTTKSKNSGIRGHSFLLYQKLSGRLCENV